MVSKLIDGKEIIFCAKKYPNVVFTEYGFTKVTNGMILNQLMIRYIGEKYFYYDKKWIMTKKDDKNHTVYNGDDILKFGLITPNKIIFGSKTYRQAYEEIIDDIIGKGKFYHRGNGRMSMYTKDDTKPRNRRNLKLG